MVTLFLTVPLLCQHDCDLVFNLLVPNDTTECINNQGVVGIESSTDCS